ncbi:PIR protein CIR protein [Plasmodium vinckei brucechwatti]|uniref:PIR protein CIR protein n=1 Tax=Plasmodium vinckei brucechwatti TaxID=119398 RepID=A0A6V7RRT7_PLAVN|nr:PIR protein CIR protein [Plasmodium vinckei brucechwatti]
MAENMCRRFLNVWSDFPDQLDKGNYQFTDDGYSESLFTNKNADNDIDKFNAVSFWLFKQLLWDSSSSSIKAKSNIDIVHYIVIWLIYMLRLKNDEKIDNIMKFYNNCISPDQNYISSIKDYYAYKSYMELINSKLFLMDRNIKDISMFYDTFKSLCKMYNEFNEDDSNCAKNLEDAQKFVEKYEILLNDNDTDTEESLYSQILSILSTDYDNFVKRCYEKKDGCDNFPSLPAYSRSSSTKNALISITFIFVAIPIFFVISYKTIYKRKDKKNKEENESLYMA